MLYQQDLQLGPYFGNGILLPMTCIYAFTIAIRYNILIGYNWNCIEVKKSNYILKIDIFINF